MAKLILINNNSLSNKIEILGYLFFKGLTGMERDVLCELVKISDGSGLTISADVGKSIRRVLNVNENSFNVALYRLNKKKTIKKNKMQITLHPILNSLFKENEFVIRFQNPEIEKN